MYMHHAVKSSHSHEDRVLFIDCIDKSVLLENTPLVHTCEDIDDVISRFFTVVCANSR